MHHPTHRHIPRRTFLAGVGATSGAALIHPLLAAAQTGAAPQRILLIHRPCGSRMDRWWPTGDSADWELSPLLAGFAPLQSDMVVLKGIRCPRNPGWNGDKHGGGMVAMISPAPNEDDQWTIIPGTDPAERANTEGKWFTAAAASIEQELLKNVPALGGTVIPSLQLGASLESMRGSGPHCLRVVSYAGLNQPLWPESRPDVAFGSIFGTTTAGMSAAALARAQEQRKSVLDFVKGGLTRLQPRLPSSQLPKLEAHLESIRALEQSVQGAQTGCMAPELEALPDADGADADDVKHALAAKQQLQIIKTAFQCDLTRVASLTFGYGNSSLHFDRVFPDGLPIGEGHHDISHTGGDDATNAIERIDKFYLDLTAEMLLDMKNTPEGDGSMLDNTLVLVWNECSVGGNHDVADMPIVFFGGKFLGLQGGSYLQLDDRTMADVWVETANRFGHPLSAYGDEMWNRGSVPGLYG